MTKISEVLFGFLFLSLGSCGADAPSPISSEYPCFDEADDLAQGLQHAVTYEELYAHFDTEATPDDLERSTFDRYRADVSDGFFGKYIEARRSLDLEWHKNYTRVRQLFQDHIVDDILARGSSKPPATPRIVFTAGAMGAGKSHMLQHVLASEPDLQAAPPVVIDMDIIRHRLPETAKYAPLKVGYLTNRESGFIQEIVLKAALERKVDIIVDSSLKDAAWNHELFRSIRTHYPEYMIEIYYVQTEREILFQRVAQREAADPRRYVPPDLVERSIALTAQSVGALREIADRTVYYDNSGDEPRRTKEYSPVAQQIP